MGCISGSKEDKSQAFEYETGKFGTPIIKDSKLTLECSVQDIYNADAFENFMLKIEHTYAEDSILNEAGKIDYSKFKPVLFEFPTYEYLRMGDIIAKCKFSKNK